MFSIPYVINGLSIFFTIDATLFQSTYGAIQYYPGIWRDYPTPLGGGIDQADSFYGRLSDAYAEVSRLAGNEAKLVKQFKRFRLTGDIIDGPFIMNETCQKQGDPGITGVIDTGLAKISGHTPWSGMPTLEIKRISQASAAQRAGRAGRTQPGVVVRL